MLAAICLSLEMLSEDRRSGANRSGKAQLHTAVFTATEYSLIWRMLDLLGFPGLALYLILGKLLAQIGYIPDICVDKCLRFLTSLNQKA